MTELNIASFAALYAKASPETLLRLRAMNSAFYIVCDVCSKEFKGLGYWAWVPYWGSRRWAAYEKMQRVGDYLYNRRDEIMLTGE